MGISIIVPVVDEEKALVKLLPFLNSLQKKPEEIIVVDGGDSRRTKEITESNGCLYLKSEKQRRAIQQHLGVLNASYETLCFLHADTFPNPQFISQIETTLSDKGIALGGFVSIMKGRRTRYWISYLNYAKTYFCPLIFSPRKHWRGLRLLFGDQVLFCRKADYLASGGFDVNDKVMEEANFCVRMNTLGRIKLVHHFVYSSDRRVAEWGFWKANRIYIGIAMGWALGFSTQKLADQYVHIR